MYVDFFKAGVQRTPEYRDKINEMGEAPVLAHGSKKLSQSGVILLYLAERSGNSSRAARTSDWKRCAGSFSHSEQETRIDAVIARLELLGQSACGLLQRPRVSLPV